MRILVKVRTCLRGFVELKQIMPEPCKLENEHGSVRRMTGIGADANSSFTSEGIGLSSDRMPTLGLATPQERRSTKWFTWSREVGSLSLWPEWEASFGSRSG